MDDRAARRRACELMERGLPAARVAERIGRDVTEVSALPMGLLTALERAEAADQGAVQ